MNSFSSNCMILDGIKIILFYDNILIFWINSSGIFSTIMSNYLTFNNT